MSDASAHSSCERRLQNMSCYLCLTLYFSLGLQCPIVVKNHSQVLRMLTCEESCIQSAFSTAPWLRSTSQVLHMHKTQAKRNFDIALSLTGIC